MTVPPVEDPTAELPVTLAHAWGEPAFIAAFKSNPADFCVDEELGYLPSGSGEHLCLRVSKTGITTRQVVERLARFASVRDVDIGYAGQKDKQGICTQWFSICLPGSRAPDLESLNDATLRVLETAWNSRKIRLGTHRGNRFRIRLRNVSSTSGPAINAADRRALSARLDRISAQGVPNYFGEQRFGRDGDNVAQALAWFEGGRKPRRFERGILLSAARSQLFNTVLSRRVADGTWNTLLQGDVMNLAGTESVFVPDRWDEALVERLQEQDIHPTGPLWGEGELRTQMDARALECAVRDESSALCRGLEMHGLQQSRRTLRLLPGELQYAFSDETADATDLSIGFSLPPGTYATAVLREICNTVQPHYAARNHFSQNQFSQEPF